MASAPLPLPAWSFRVTLGGESAAFTEVTGLAVERETATYAHGLSHWEGEALTTFPSRKHRQISCKRGVIPGDSRFHDWLVAADAEPRAMDVQLVDAQGEPRIVWRIRQAIPIRLTGPDFRATGNEVAIDSLDLMVAGVSVEQG